MGLSVACSFPGLQMRQLAWLAILGGPSADPDPFAKADHVPDRGGSDDGGRRHCCPRAPADTPARRPPPRGAGARRRGIYGELLFPVPPDAMIVPMVLARRTRWARMELPVKTLDQRAMHHLHRMVVDRMGPGPVCRGVPGFRVRAVSRNREWRARRSTVIKIIEYYRILAYLSKLW